MDWVRFRFTWLTSMRFINGRKGVTSTTNGKQLLLPTGHLLLMPTIAARSWDELHRRMIANWWETGNSTGNSEILLPGNPTDISDFNTIATNLLAPPHTFVPLLNNVLDVRPDAALLNNSQADDEPKVKTIDGVQAMRVLDLLAECEAGPSQRLVTGMMMTVDSSGTMVGDQREARLAATQKLHGDGFVGLLDELDDQEIKRFEGFIVLSTPGHVMGDESGLVRVSRWMSWRMQHYVELT